MAVGYFGLTFREVLGLSALSYIGQAVKGLCYRIPNKDNVLSDHDVWQVYDVFEDGKYNFIHQRKRFSHRAILVNRLTDLDAKVLVFSGSDSPVDDWGDWWTDNLQQGLRGFSPQYDMALRETERVRPRLLVGHSLGGGLASYAAIHTGIRALTVNPAPLHVHAGNQKKIGDAKEKVINFVAQGEVLDLITDLSHQHKIGNKSLTSLGGATFSRLIASCRGYKNVKTLPYMKRVGEVIYMNCKAGIQNPAQRHLLPSFTEYREAMWEGNTRIK